MKERKGRLVGKIITIACIASGIACILLTFMGVRETRSSYMKATQAELKTAVTEADSEFSKMWDGDWEWDGSTITKGGQPVYDEYLETMESLKSETELDYTIFYENTRVITTLKSEGTNEYSVGATVSEEVTNTVIGKGEVFYRANFELEGQKYYAYYSPMENPDGTAVGMMFVGKKADEINSDIRRATIILLTISIITIIVLAAIGISQSVAATKAMNEISEAIITVSGGNLVTPMPEHLIARTDELGIIAESTENLRSELLDIIGTSIHLSGQVSSSGDELSSSAGQASDASTQVTDAVNDISEGAVSQAESVQESATNVGEIGEDIANISDNVDTLNNNTDIMKDACTNSMNALEKLLSQNASVTESMHNIDTQIHNTNKAVLDISESSKLITGIASQTNLLALNASIEAARAGEAGKGFAVVADEIGQLASQSAETAKKINDIIVDLTRESEESIATIEQMNEELNAQSKQLDETREDMELMQKGVDNVSNNAGEISGRVTNLDTAKTNLVDIIESLSAVSEENAASTEETNASMQELNATFEIINRAADDLKGLAVSLNDKISFFTIEEES